MSYDYLCKIVLDPGSAFFKGGFSLANSPHVIESIVREQYTEEQSFSPYSPPSVVVKRTVTRPIEKGIVTDWDRMERLYTQMLYYKLHLNGKNGQVQDFPGMIVAENMCNTRRAREKTAELMFDKFGVNSLCIYSAPLLSLLSSTNVHKKQMYSGVVVELGLTNSFIVPVDNFTIYSGAWARIGYGGQHITDHLTKLLSTNTGTLFSSETIESTKLSYARVSEDFSSEPIRYDDMICLPYGQMFGPERFECTEQLFTENRFCLPLHIVKYTEKACHSSAVKHKDLIKQDIMRKADIYENLCSNIVLSGGTSVIPGLCPRLYSELINVRYSPLPVSHLPVAEQYGAWKGAALMANMDDFDYLWVSRAEFEDSGVQILYKKWPPVNTIN